jgi:hypothetical protein
MQRKTASGAALVRASLGLTASLLLGTFQGGCVGVENERTPVAPTMMTSGAAGAPSADAAMSSSGWTSEGRARFWMLDRPPLGMSRDGRRVLEDDGTLWMDDGASATVVPTVDDPVALSGDGDAVVARLGDSTCATLARWTTASLEPVAPHGAPGAVRADADVVVGTASFGCDAASRRRAFMWSGNGAMSIEPLSTDDDRTEALALSADGTTLIGFSSSTATGQGRLFSWRASAGAAPLEDARISSSGYGTFVSDDGRVVAGTLVDDVGVASAFVWSAVDGDGLEVVPSLSTRANTYVVALGGDGKTVLALGTDGGDGIAFTWSKAAGPTQLSGPDGALEVDALVMSADGSLIVGAPVGDDGAPIAWDAQRSPTRLFGDAPSFSSACRPNVTSLAADGKTVAGSCNAPDGPRGFVARLH